MKHLKNTAKKDETRLVRPEDAGRHDTHIVPRQARPQVVFEIHKNENGTIYTSRYMCGRDRALVQDVSAEIIRQLIKKYKFRHHHLVVMSDESSGEGIWVWVRSRVPIPLIALEVAPPLKQFGKDFVDISVYETHHQRLKNGPVLGLNPPSDNVIDV